MINLTILGAQELHPSTLYNVYLVSLIRVGIRVSYVSCVWEVLEIIHFVFTKYYFVFTKYYFVITKYDFVFTK